MAIDQQTQNRIKWSLRAILAFMFLISAVAKIAKGWIPEFPFIDFSPHFALTTFENKQLIPMGFSEFWASHFSRTLIGCELALGIGLLQPHYFKRLVLPLSFLMLFLFSAQLTYEIATTGNVGNCGCFGALIPMTPVQALVKNLLAIGMIAYLYRFTEKTDDKKDAYLISTLILGSILAIYMAGPVRQKTTQVAAFEAYATEDSLVAEVDSVVTQPAERADSTGKKQTPEKVAIKEPKSKRSGYANWYADIDKGRKILCFFAPGCDHCKETAKELTQMKKEIKDFPEVRIVFMDEEAELIPDFFAFAGTKYPFKIADIATFWQTMGTSRETPAVMYLWNGNMIKEYDGINEKKFDRSGFKKIVTKPWE
ncbi:MAG: TlpA family protein disulfide reductase [Bacteroidota bacterium]|jgi:thiol-disulfide isomerase/thioredoxin